MVIARPPIKWAGGKTKLLPEILARLPAKIGTYYEPFLGGGAVFFALAAEKRFERAIISDANEELMNAYAVIAQNVDGLVRELKKPTYVYGETSYYHIRSLNPTESVKRAARFIYLNRTGFNGLYRVNSSGKFNVPFGRYTNPTICDEENLRAVSNVLGDVWTGAVGFEKAFEQGIRAQYRLPTKGDGAYIDPPYLPLSKTSDFTAYTKSGFGVADQERLRDHFAMLDKRGVHVLLSNSDTPLIRKLYDGFRVEVVEAPRRVNSNGGKRGNVTELLISGKNGR